MELYALALTVGGKGAASPPRAGCIPGALGNAWTAELYRCDEEAEKAGLLFAAYLFVYLVRGHCFVDGNKRVAWLALLQVLAHYHVQPTCDTSDVVELCDNLLLPGSLMDADDVLDWLIARLESVTFEG